MRPELTLVPLHYPVAGASQVSVTLGRMLLRRGVAPIARIRISSPNPRH